MLLGTTERFLQEMWVSNSAKEKKGHIIGKEGGVGVGVRTNTGNQSRWELQLKD